MNCFLFKIVFLLCLIYTPAKCQNVHENNPESNDTIISYKNSLEVGKKTIIYLDSLKSNYQVLNGILVNIDSLDLNEYTRIIRLKDFEKLSNIGVPHPNKSYTFLFTEQTKLYRYLYKHVRKKLPISLIDMQFPIFIDGQIIPLEMSKSLDRINTDSIKKVVFLPKSSPEIINNDTIVYGVIKIIL